MQFFVMFDITKIVTVFFVSVINLILFFVMFGITKIVTVFFFFVSVIHLLQFFVSVRYY